MTTPYVFDVVTIGGGPAGLSGALLLARSRRSVLVIDAGEPRNAPAHAMHNFLSRDGVDPAELLERGRAEVRTYGGEIWSGRATSVARDAHGFSVTLEDGRTVHARRLLVTTGLVDQLPDVDGVRERWGRDVLHCPYCHGWEVRDQTIGVLATGPAAVHMALLFRQLTAEVVYFAHSGEALSDEQAAQFAARGIRVVEGTVAALDVRDDRLHGVRLADGAVVDCQALVVTPKYVARGVVLASLGLTPVPHPMGYGESIPADATGRTEVPGVWVAGNVTDLAAGVIASAAAGTTVAAQLNADLVAEDTQRALPDGHTPATRLGHPGQTTDILREDFWDARYGEADQIWSGNPNPHLVAQIEGQSPGLALDVGSGEGGDAMWLAARGWQVIAMDVSRVALDRGRAAAARLGPDIAARITWVHADVLGWDAAEQQFDLVSAQFLHFTSATDVLYRRLAELVRPGGTLLVVGHHPDDMPPSAHVGHHNIQAFFFTADEVAAALDPSEWHVLVAAAPEREAVDAEGHPRVIRDVVLQASRLPAARN